MPDKKFPRTLYKKGGDQKFYSKSQEYLYSSEIVENEKEMKEVMKQGYIDDFSEAIFGPEDAIDEKELDEDF